MEDIRGMDWGMRMRVRLGVVACFLAGGALLQWMQTLHLLHGGA